VGKKTNWGWTCGDAVANDHLKFIKEKSGLTFQFPELDLKVDGVVALSPDFKSRYLFDGEGYTLDRPLFEQKLLKDALRHGVEYVSEFEVEAPLIENNYVVGIFGKDKNKAHKEIRAKVVIDCLGVATTIRRKLPENPFVDKDVDINDVESTGRYIYECDIDHVDLSYYDEKNALIHLNQNVSPGGYGWVFPKSNGKVNIGLGVQKRSLELRNQKLGRKDTLHTLIDEYVRSNPVIKNVRLFNKDNNGKGYWSVAVRRQLDSLVFNGYMGAGDSMAMPNPISAGGIGPALVAGILSGENAAIAVHNGDVSTAGLWKYNLDFNESYGYKTAGLEVFRVYLQSLNNDLLNYGMKMFITAQDASDLGYGRIPEHKRLHKSHLCGEEDEDPKRDIHKLPEKPHRRIHKMARTGRFTHEGSKGQIPAESYLIDGNNGNLYKIRKGKDHRRKGPAASLWRSAAHKGSRGYN
jgi:digeranylgeranylglycerophospholipid reductase